MKVCLWPSLKLKGHKVENFWFFFSFLSFLSLLLQLIWMACSSKHDVFRPRGGTWKRLFNKYEYIFSNLSRQNSRRYITGGLREEEIQENTEKQKGRESDGFSLGIPIPRNETGGSHQGGNRRAIDHPTWRITQEAGTIKG